MRQLNTINTLSVIEFFLEEKHLESMAHIVCLLLHFNLISQYSSLTIYLHNSMSIYYFRLQLTILFLLQHELSWWLIPKLLYSLTEDISLHNNEVVEWSAQITIFHPSYIIKYNFQLVRLICYEKFLNLSLLLCCISPGNIGRISETMEIFNLFINFCTM